MLTLVFNFNKEVWHLSPDELSGHIKAQAFSF